MRFLCSALLFSPLFSPFSYILFVVHKRNSLPSYIFFLICVLDFWKNSIFSYRRSMLARFYFMCVEVEVWLIVPKENSELCLDVFGPSHVIRSWTESIKKSKDPLCLILPTGVNFELQDMSLSSTLYGLARSTRLPPHHPSWVIYTLPTLLK